MLLLQGSLMGTSALGLAAAGASTDVYFRAIHGFSELPVQDNMLSLTQAIPATQAIATSLEQLEVAPRVVQQAQDMVRALEEDAQYLPQAQIPMPVLLNDLRSYGIVPLAGENPRQAIDRLRKLTRDFAFDPDQGAHIKATIIGQAPMGLGYPGERRPNRTLEVSPRLKTRFTQLEYEPTPEPEDPTVETPPIPEPAVQTEPVAAEAKPLPSVIVKDNFPKPLNIQGHSDVRYSLIRELGKGATSEVCVVHDQAFDCERAIKIVHPRDRRISPELFVELFRNEGRIQAGLNSRRIVIIHDTGLTADGKPFIIMDLMQGALMDYLDAIKHGDQQYNFDVMVEFAKQAVAAVNEVNNQGVLHKDIKPENFFIDYDSNILLGDFGISERESEVNPETSETINGTPLYLSMEGFRGEPANRSRDVYALGAMLYEMFSGQEPFQIDNDEKGIVRHVGQKMQHMPPAPSLVAPDRQIPAEIDRIILKAMATNEFYKDEAGRRDPSKDRYHTAEELLFDLITYKARSYEEEAAVNEKAAKALLRGDRPDRNRHRKMMRDWKGFVLKAIDAYNTAYEEFPLDAIRERLFDLYAPLLSWANAYGHEQLRMQVAAKMAAIRPDNPYTASAHRPVEVKLDFDGVDPRDNRYTMRVFRWSDDEGILKMDGHVYNQTGPLRPTLRLVRGYSYSIRIDHPQYHSITSPLPARPSGGKPHEVRLPFYAQGNIPEDFVIIPAGPVPVITSTGTRYSEKIRKEDWREIDYDFAIGPKVTNRQYLEYLRTMAKGIKTQRNESRRIRLRSDFEEAIPSHWDPGLRMRIRDGQRVQVNQLKDRNGRRLHEGAAVTGVPYRFFELYFRYAYPNFDVAPADLNEWKKVMRGIDLRRYPWGDVVREGVANWRYEGLATEAAAREPRWGLFRDVSPYSLFSLGGIDAGIWNLVSDTRTLLRPSLETAAKIFEMNRLQVDVNDPEAMAVWSFFVGVPFDDSPPHSIDIAKPESIDNRSYSESAGCFPVIRLNTARPTPSLDTLIS